MPLTHVALLLDYTQNLQSQDLLPVTFRVHLMNTIRNPIFPSQAASTARIPRPDTRTSATAIADPVTPAQRSESARTKTMRRHHGDGTPIHSFATLLTALATVVRNTCRTSTASDAPTVTVTTRSNPLQRQAMDLTGQMAV